MKIKDALEIVGGLSVPSKLPCYSYSIPASRCKVGSKLRNVKGSVCSHCYAHKGFYKLYPAVGEALENRFNKLNDTKWVEAMTHLILHKEKSGYFRWHDSGDIQDMTHLENIVKVCENTPNVKHWLPTREYKLINDYVESGKKFPKNLIIRLSALMIEGKPPTNLAKKLGVVTSGVSKNNYNCKAPQQKNKCEDCRMCWDKSIENVVYHSH